MNDSTKAIVAILVVVSLLGGGIAAIFLTNDNGSDPKPEPEPEPTVTVKNEEMNITGVIDDGVVAYRGVQFAKPPTGELRFEAPVPADPYPRTETLDCTTWGDLCWQCSPIALTSNMGEDCLNLNIWAPTDAVKGKNLPVYVWIYGGANYFGDGGYYDCHQFAKDGVITVTINHRMAGLGFLATEAWKDKIYNGNFGMLDQICALKWIHQYIANFGGDPDNVTVGGLSSGSFNVFNLILCSDQQSTRGQLEDRWPLPEGDNGERRGVDDAEQMHP